MRLTMTTRAALTATILGLIAFPGCSSPSGSPEQASPVLLASVPAMNLAESGMIPEGEIAEAADGERPLARLSLIRRGEERYSPWHLEFDSAASCDAFKVPGAAVFARFDRWADVFVPVRADVRMAVLRAPGLVWNDPEGNLILPPPPPVGEVASRATPEPIVRGGLGGLKGKGVIVAIVDSGIDFRHPDFQTKDTQGRPVSRIAYFWDTTSADHERGIGDKGPISYPNGAPIGTVFSREQLSEELRSSQKRIGVTDANGHGTSCAGVAAGNGSGYPDRRYAGVAPEADLIAVRVGGAAGSGLENTYLLGAICGWIDHVAGKTPAVVSCSFGGQYGSRDGAFVLERQLDARFASTVRSRALCIAAGNEARMKLHAEASFKSADQAGRIEWTVPPGSEASVLVCFSSGNRDDLSWISKGTDAVNRTTMASDVNPFTKQARMAVMTGAGSYAIDLFTASGSPGTADAYIATVQGSKPAVFTGEGARTGKQVGVPGTTLQAITVGSYDFNDQLLMNGKSYTFGNKAAGVAPLTIGALSSYSNPGPRRTGDAIKPDLVAPGQFHTASRVLGKAKSTSEFVETSEKYRYFNGTSAATPYCAGVIALMLEKNPTLTVGEIRTLLHTKASRDRQTGTTPNAAWGYGKLDVAAVRAILAAVRKP